MLGVQQRRDYHIEAHGLTLLGGSRNKQVWRTCEVHHLELLGDGDSESDRKFELRVPEVVAVQQAPQRYNGRFVVGHLYTHRILKSHNTYTLGVEGHGNIILQGPD